MRNIRALCTRYAPQIAACIAVIVLTVVIERFMGRSYLGPDGRFGWWDGNIWGSENSQRVADAYSFSHIIHGVVFFGFLWLVARRVPLRHRFMIAVLLEAAWEILENSPLIINRYRAVTIALGYDGDSILNSISDIGMMALGFWIAARAKLWMVVALVVVFEVGCLIWIRDNLTLNIIMLLYPIDGIREWQSAGQAVLRH